MRTRFLRSRPWCTFGLVLAFFLLHQNPSFESYIFIISNPLVVLRSCRLGPRLDSGRNWAESWAWMERLWGKSFQNTYRPDTTVDALKKAITSLSFHSLIFGNLYVTIILKVVRKLGLMTLSVQHYWGYWMNWKVFDSLFFLTLTAPPPAVPNKVRPLPWEPAFFVLDLDVPLIWCWLSSSCTRTRHFRVFVTINFFGIHSALSLNLSLNFCFWTLFKLLNFVKVEIWN